MTTSGASSAHPVVLLTVGTDHHAFDRIVRWTEEFIASWVADDVEVICQHGTAKPMVGAINHAFLAHDELLSDIERATAIVCHGGPGSILEAVRAGRTPIVVPRVRSLNEAVDDHQVHFSRFLGRRGEVFLAEERSEMHAVLARVLVDPDACRPTSRTSSDVATVDAAVEHFAAFARQVSGPRPDTMLRRMVRRGRGASGVA